MDAVDIMSSHMYRVVTKSMVIRNGSRRRQIDLGPWQPSEELARSWAQYLEATGRYDTVVVQSNGMSSLKMDRYDTGEELTL